MATPARDGLSTVLGYICRAADAGRHVNPKAMRSAAGTSKNVDISDSAGFSNHSGVGVPVHAQQQGQHQHLQQYCQQDHQQGYQQPVLYPCLPMLSVPWCLRRPSLLPVHAADASLAAGVRMQQMPMQPSFYQPAQTMSQRCGGHAGEEGQCQCHGIVQAIREPGWPAGIPTTPIVAGDNMCVPGQLKSTTKEGFDTMLMIRPPPSMPILLRISCSWPCGAWFGARRNSGTLSLDAYHK